MALVLNKRGIISVTVFAIFYAVLELGMRWDPSHNSGSPLWMREVFTPLISLYFYRVIYTVLFLIPSYLASGKLWSLSTLWYLIYGSTLEDIVYWVIDLRIPYSWAWFYPVIKGIPLDDIFGIIALWLIYKYMKVKSKTSPSS